MADTGQLILISLLVVLLLSLWKYLAKNHDYFLKRGIPYEEPLLLIGSFKNVFFQIDSFSDWLLDVARKHRSAAFFGIFDMFHPTYVLHDPGLIKDVTVKHFDRFTNRIGFGYLKADHILNKFVFSLKSKAWKDMRTTLTPAFTSSKMRVMWEMVNEVVDDSSNYINENLCDGRIQIDAVDFYSRITTDVTAACGFGLKNSSLRERENQMHHFVSRAFNVEATKQKITLHLARLSQSLSDFLRLRLIPIDVMIFFNNVAKSTLKYRKDTGIVRPDLFHLLTKAFEGELAAEKNIDKDDILQSTLVEPKSAAHSLKKRNWTYHDIAAQVAGFLVAGNETTAVTLSFCSYELALNQDKQEKLFLEIQKENSDQISYDNIQKLPYLDAVLAEVLRKYPPSFIIDRICQQDTVVSDSSGNSVMIPTDMRIWINIFGMHYNNKYFPSPQRFEPERFLPGNRDKIISGSYLPFGFGPRSCIGSRFAVMEIKLLVFRILSEFRIVPCDQTMIPLKLGKGFLLTPKRSLIVELIKRD